jgi:hypothetical protein
MRPTGENNHIGSQSPFVTLANEICSTPISAAIFQRIYAAVNTGREVVQGSGTRKQSPNQIQDENNV